MRKWIVRLLVLLAAVGALLALRATVLAPEPLAVEVVAVTRGTVESTVTNTRAGTLQARRRALLSPEVGGRVEELAHREGARVEAGELLLRMDSSSPRARLGLAQASLATARARHAESCVLASRAERELERNRLLAQEKLLSDDQLDRFESALEMARAACDSSAAAVEQAEAEVRVVQAELEKYALHAPFAGVIAKLSVELGEYVTPAPPGVPIPPLIDLVDTSEIYVSAPMDEVDSGLLAVGQPVRVTLDPFPGRSFAGRVARVAPYVLDVEEQNRTVEIEVELAPTADSERFLPGSSADVEVVLEERAGVLRIPTATVLEGGRVLLVESGRLVERRIESGLRNWDWTEVRAGLAEGERVLSSLGMRELRPGARAVASERNALP